MCLKFSNKFTYTKTKRQFKTQLLYKAEKLTGVVE